MREYVDKERWAHSLEGYAGDFIAPISVLHLCKQVLHADIEAGESGDLALSDPQRSVLTSPGIAAHEIPLESLVQVRSMAALGVFTHTGLWVTSKIWGKVEFVYRERRTDAFELRRELIGTLHREGLAGKRVIREQTRMLGSCAGRVPNWPAFMGSCGGSEVVPCSLSIEARRFGTSPCSSAIVSIVSLPVCEAATGRAWNGATRAALAPRPCKVRRSPARALNLSASSPLTIRGREFNSVKCKTPTLDPDQHCISGWWPWRVRTRRNRVTQIRLPRAVQPMIFESCVCNPQIQLSPGRPLEDCATVDP